MPRLVSRNNRIVVLRSHGGSSSQPTVYLADDGQGNECCCFSCFLSSRAELHQGQKTPPAGIPDDYYYNRRKPRSQCHRVRVWEYRDIVGDAQGNATGFSGSDAPDHELETTGRFYNPRHKFAHPFGGFYYARGPFYSGYDSSDSEPDDTTTPLDQHPLWWPRIFPGENDEGGVGGYAFKGGNGPSAPDIFEEMLLIRDPETREIIGSAPDRFDEYIGCTYHIFALVNAFYFRFNDYDPATDTYSDPNTASDGGYLAQVLLVRSDLVDFAPGGGPQ